MIKFYWFWFVLISVHLWLFVALPDTISRCMEQPQVDQETGAIILYGQDGYKCNTFNSNAFIIIFYIIVCFYLGL